MPYLIYLGTNQQNLSGTSAKGYWIRRSGADVRARWGPIDAAGARGGHFSWRPGGQSQEWPLGTDAAAKTFLDGKVDEKLSEGYDLLPPGRKIE